MANKIFDNCIFSLLQIDTLRYPNVYIHLNNKHDSRP